MQRHNFLSATLACAPRHRCGPVSLEVQAQRLATQREDLEVSIQYTKKLLGL